jgi:hypothetical protein
MTEYEKSILGYRRSMAKSDYTVAQCCLACAIDLCDDAYALEQLRDLYTSVTAKVPKPFSLWKPTTWRVN